MLTKKIFLIAVLTLTVLSIPKTQKTLAAEYLDVPTGTIRGGVYTDEDGNGRCSPADGDGQPVPNVDIEFRYTDSNKTLSLYTGSDGTFGLVKAAQGEWQVTAKPNAAWSVTSPNPLTVMVSEDTSLTQLNVNFCLRPASAASFFSSPIQTIIGNNTAMRSVPVPVETTPTPISFENTNLTDSEISEILLTNPPEPIPAPNLDQAAKKDVELIPEADWLFYLNYFREIANLPRLQGAKSLSEGSQLHSRYMVLNDEPIAHKEERANELYTPAGDQAARNANIFASSQILANYNWSINFWISGPFHLVPIIDPALTVVGFGTHNQAVGNFSMAAVLDVLSEADPAQRNVTYPIYFPGIGSETWVVRHSMYEWPDPLTSCPGFKRPTGAPIVLQLGNGDRTPNVTRYALYAGDRELETCMINETNYVNPKEYAQFTGRTILGERDAIVILPREPLPIDTTYRVEIETNGEFFSWEFTTRKGAPEN